MRYQDGRISSRQHRFLLPHLTLDVDIFTFCPKFISRTTNGPYPAFFHPVDLSFRAATVSQQLLNISLTCTYLQPIASSIPSFIRDSLHFKSLLTDIHIRDSDILLTLDVESFYTNIPIVEGIAAIKKSSFPKSFPWQARFLYSDPS